MMCNADRVRDKRGPGETTMSMKFRFCLAAAGLLLAVGANAASTTVKVYDLGRDGEQRYYDLRCESNRKLVLAVTHKENKMCFFTRDGKETCIKSDDVDMGAERACLATRQ